MRHLQEAHSAILSAVHRRKCFMRPNLINDKKGSPRAKFRGFWCKNNHPHPSLSNLSSFFKKHILLESWSYEPLRCVLDPCAWFSPQGWNRLLAARSALVVRFCVWSGLDTALLRMRVTTLIGESEAPFFFGWMSGRVLKGRGATINILSGHRPDSF